LDVTDCTSSLLLSGYGPADSLAEAAGLESFACAAI